MLSRKAAANWIACGDAAYSAAKGGHIDLAKDLYRQFNGTFSLFFSLSLLFSILLLFLLSYLFSFSSSSF